jgi:hypothetical protein
MSGVKNTKLSKREEEMKEIIGKWLALFMLAFSLAACQAVGAAPAASTPTPAPLSGANASRLGASALLLLQASTGIGNQLVPVSMETGKPVPGYATVDFGSYTAYAFSDDRTLMAFVAWGIEGCTGQCLHILDLRAWKETIQPVALAQDTFTWNVISFDTSAKHLAVAFNAQDKPSSQLMLVDLSQPAIIKQITLPQPVFQMAFTQDHSLALYGDAARKEGNGFVLRVMLLDEMDLTTQWQQDLEQVQYSDESQANLADPSQGKFYIPAAAFSPDKSQLYAIPGDQDLLVTVNFAKRSVQSMPIQPPKSLLERLLASGVETVYAKSLNGAMKFGTLSPDGSVFYVTGQTSVAVKDANGDWMAQTTPLGLQAVRTSDGALLASQPGKDMGDVSLTLDGKYLLMKHWSEQNMGYPQAVTQFIDPQTWQVAQRLEGDIQSTRLLDGSLAWLSSNPQANGGYQLAMYAPGAPAPHAQWSEPVNRFIEWVQIP